MRLKTFQAREYCVECENLLRERAAKLAEHQFARPGGHR
ncbi:hypothetical protein LMG29660_06842 [Burkholderia puraquae]|uniref:Uncharacterized protein n=1 Tax=Burkholderia puraquae TaxID=1904757 RepID=A0A6J5F138_9BURK|nr:hypothetical protein LMG29660_06842 [Burkholderia puraquae]